LLTGSLSSFDHSSSLIRLVTKLQLELPAPKLQALKYMGQNANPVKPFLNYQSTLQMGHSVLKNKALASVSV